MTDAELQELAADRQLRSGEIFEWNDFYAHAAILKAYAELPQGYRLKCVIEHSFGLGGKQIHEPERAAPLPAILTMSAARFATLRQYTNKALFSVGPIIHYAEPWLDTATMQSEARRLGRSLLVFPFHSTHHIDTHFDTELLCDAIEEAALDFDSVRVCLYWRDIQRGAAETYMQRGFECVSAGHMYDPLFLPRLKSLILLSAATMANSVGSALGNSLALGRPHFILAQELERSAASAEILQRDMQSQDRNFEHSELYRHTMELFGNDLPAELTAEQQAYAEHYCGVKEIRSPEELREIAELCEDMYKRRGHGAAERNKLMIQQLRDYYTAGEYQRADALSRYARHVYPAMRGLRLQHALVLQRLNRAADARMLVEGLLQKHGEDTLARRIHTALGGATQTAPPGAEPETEQEIHLASYPRSGNTWARYLIADVLLQARGYTTGSDLPLDLERIIPDSHLENPVEPAGLGFPFRLSKSHELCGRLAGRIIYILRQPADALLSYYYFHLRYEYLQAAAQAGPDAFCLHHAPDWCAHVQAALHRAAERPDALCLVAYESLHSAPEQTLGRAMEFLGVECTPSMLARAVEHHTFAQRSAREIPGEYPVPFIRKGIVGGALQELREETLQAIDAQAMPLYRQARELEGRASGQA